MAEFIEREVVSIRDYDLYCHYVAGLVGIGLTQVGLLASPHCFSASALDDWLGAWCATGRCDMTLLLQYTGTSSGKPHLSAKA